MTRIVQLAGVVGRKLNDGWSNALTGLGIHGKDKRLSMSYCWRPMTEMDCEHLYAVSDVARRVCDYVPDEGTREWIEVRAGAGGPNDPNAQAVVAEFERLHAREKLRQAWKWARSYGGAGVLVMVDDGLKLSEPMDLSRVRAVRSLVVVNRFELVSYDLIANMDDPNFGQVATYQLSPSSGDTSALASQMIHHSRVIRFDGALLPRRLWETNQRWHDSILNKMINAIRNYEGAHDSIASAVQDFRLVVLKLKRLADMVGSDEEGAKLLNDRIQLMNITKSTLNAIALDADNEALDHVGTDFANIEKVIEKIEGRLVTSTDLPHTIVLGEGATGSLSGGGESEDDNAKDFVSGQQELVLEPAIDRLLEIVQSAKMGPTRGVVIEDLDYEFKPLWQETEGEKATTHKTQAEADALYLDRGVLSPETVATSRFGGSTYSTETAAEESFAPGSDVAGKKPAAPNPFGGGNPDPNADPNLTDDEYDHAHSLYIDRVGFGYTSGANGEGDNHTHTMPNGVETGPSIPLFGGGHYHQIGTEAERYTSPAMALPMVAEMQAAVEEAKAAPESVEVEYDTKTGKLTIKGLGAGMAVQGAMVDKAQITRAADALEAVRKYADPKNHDEQPAKFRYLIRDAEDFKTGTIKAYLMPTKGVTVLVGELKQ